MLLASLFACSQIVSARREEADGRLETLVAQPFARGAWLLGRLLLAAAGTIALAVLAGVLAWLGAASQGADVGFGDMLAAGANCLPAALLFAALAALALAALPRASTALAHGLVVASFVWQLFGSLLDVPHALVALSVFDHVALVPAESFKTIAAVVMLALAALLALIAVGLFERRDLGGA